MGLMVATSAVAQSNTNTPAPVVPAPAVVTTVTEPAATVATNAPVKRKKTVVKHKKAEPAVAAKKVALKEPAVTLVPGPAEVAADNVNVRGQAGLKGEFVTHLGRGAAVTVLGQINLDKHEVDEPAQWAKIAFPTNAHVWVYSAFIDATNKTVRAMKLNLRAGPGENYSVLGVIERGTPVNPLTERGAWTQIDPPANAYAFIAAMYLKQEVSGNLAANPAPSTETQPVPPPAPAPTPTPTPVPESQPIVAETTNPPVPPVATPVPPVAEPPTNPPAVTATSPVPAVNPDTNAPVATDTNALALTSTNAAVDLTNLPPRIVTHEGVVRHVVSVIEPTDYEIYDPNTDTAIDYLYTTTTNLNLEKYKGLRIVVTGEEKLSQRWHHTPVLTVTRIQVVKK
jgi:uncharacterized protein YgiM (DUF1202 family)